MPFTKTPQKFNGSIGTVEIGAGEKKTVIAQDRCRSIRYGSGRDI